MRSTLALAALALVCTTIHPMAATPAGVALAAEENTESAWNGRWQGMTVSGQALVLQLQVQGERLTGRLTVGKQSANIVEGKVVGIAFALTTGPIDGHKVDGTGRRVGDALELTIEGVKQPLMLTRAG